MPTGNNAIGVTGSGAVSFNGTAFTGGTLSIANGGSNAASFGTSQGIVVYNGTSLVNYAGPQLSSGGVHTNTSQPAFFAYLGGTGDLNVTGDGTNWQLGSGTALTEVLDQGNNFNTNGTFTAPVTGLYLFTTGFALGEGATGTLVYGYITAGGVTYQYVYDNYADLVSGGFTTVMGSILIYLTSSQTATASIRVSGTTKTVDVESGQGQSWFAGCLMC